MGKITFLGTAGDSFIAGKQIRASGGIIIQDREIQLHIDPGPGALIKAMEYGINLRANTAILVSNNQLINCNDVNAVIDAMTYGGLDKKGVLVSSATIVNGTDVEKPYLTEKHKGFLERIIVLQQGQKLGIEEVEINAMQAINNDPNAIGFKIYTSESVIGYTSNTKYTKEIAKTYKGCDILILKVTAPTNEKIENELNSDDVIKFVKEINPQLVIMTHFGVKMLKADPLIEGRMIQKQTGIQILTAKDGMSLTPTNYAAKSKQKRLNFYKDQETGIVTKEEIKTTEEEQHNQQNNQQK